ncbi:hypothetical protein ACSBR1_032986 [Camellia fascicularis]
MATRAVCKSQQLRYLFFTPTLNKFILHKPSSLSDVVCKVSNWGPASVPLFEIRSLPLWGTLWIHSGRFLNTVDKVVEQPEHSGSSTVADGAGDVKKKRKKLKGKRAVVRWLKLFRFKKKKEYERMTAEEKILYKMRKALDKSKYRDGLRSVRKYIPRLEQDLELLHAKAENKTNVVEETLSTGIDSADSGNISKPQLGDSDRLKLLMAKNEECPEYDPASESGMGSDSEDLSDIFETDSDTENEEKKTEQPLYLDEFEKFLVQTDEMEDFEEHLSQMSADSVKGKSVGKDEELPDLDEVDQMFLQAASLLKKKRRKR